MRVEDSQNEKPLFSNNKNIHIYFSVIQANGLQIKLQNQLLLNIKKKRTRIF